jgi:hypothetical protein
MMHPSALTRFSSVPLSRSTEEDIEEVRSLVETLVTFFDELRRASERLGVQLAAVFQV